MRPAGTLTLFALSSHVVDPNRLILTQALGFAPGGLLVSGAVGPFAGLKGQRAAQSAGLAKWLSRIDATIFGALALQLAPRSRS